MRKRPGPELGFLLLDEEAKISYFRLFQYRYAVESGVPDETKIPSGADDKRLTVWLAGAKEAEKQANRDICPVD